MPKADMPAAPLLLTLDECATILRVSPRTVRRMIRRGELVALKLGDGPNRPLRIVDASVREFLKQRLRG
jgi:excisionase family DNA binding protein